ncbi:MAG: STAS/SEC14 domain-containing protein [Verrucomicrobiales bacterium]
MAIENKAIELTHTAGGKLVEVQATGKLEKADYAFFAPEVDRIIQEQGKINMLVSLRDFHGWTAGALWEDVKFDAKHFRDIERLAIVGEDKWEKGMARFCHPFTTAEIKFFRPGQIDEARRWVVTGS